MHEKQQKQVIITGKKIGNGVVTERKIISPTNRRIKEFTVPERDEEWDAYFEQQQYGYGADITSRHGMDLACASRPHGPWFERLP